MSDSKRRSLLATFAVEPLGIERSLPTISYAEEYACPRLAHSAQVIQLFLIPFFATAVRIRSGPRFGFPGTTAVPRTGMRMGGYRTVYLQSIAYGERRANTLGC